MLAHTLLLNPIEDEKLSRFFKLVEQYWINLRSERANQLKSGAAKPRA
jgi:hypothetical protein